MTYRLPFIKRVSRKMVVPVFRGLFNLLSQIEVHGLENIPEQGAYLIAFNHVSIFDPPILAAFWPTPPEALGANEVWKRKGQGILVYLYGAVPVRRGEVDRAAMSQLLEILRSGKPLLVSPEGRRSHQPGLQQARPGVVYLVERTGVPVVPVGIVGTTDDFLKKALRGDRPRVTITIGKHFHLPEMEDQAHLSPKQQRQVKVDYIMQQVAAMLPEEYRGYYSIQPSG
jgi:1-acyl-sn-glycerol-3-phosphate acyltransferase